MEQEHSIPWADDLVANLGWVQRLALSIARNPDTADDVTQEVARVWLERRPDLAEPPRGVRAWLAAVTRRLTLDRVRSESARHAREQSVSRPEAVVDAYEVVERGAWQKRVTEAVMDLPEPYRSTILYCYLDQLPSRIVAERMAVRDATVRKRLERGLTMLRARLRGRRDRAGAFFLSCADLKRHGTAVREALRAQIAGVLIMTTKTKLAGLAIAAGLVLLFALRAFSGSIEGERVTTAPAPVVLSEDARHDSDAATTPSDPREPMVAAVERKALAAPPAPTKGSLLVHVVWSDDKKPAANVLMSLYRDGADALLDEPYTTTDEQGTVRFADLAPGRVYAEIHRGENHWGDPITIEAGKQTESTIEVPGGMDCKGRVVDEKGRPVADAEVLVAGWAGGEALPLARTAPDGTFELRAVDTHCHIGARASGYAASRLRQFTAGKGAKVEFEIRLEEPAAILNGVVLDPERRALAGAVVQVGIENGKMEKLADGAVAKAPMPPRVRTDAQGRFAFQSLPSGAAQLLVRARGLSPSSQPIELQAGREANFTVQLEPGVTLVGSVRDSSGAKVPRVEISVGDWEDLSRLSTRSDAGGEFRLEGVGHGDLKVHAERDGQGTAQTTLHALAGETVRWDPVLSKGLELRGLVLDVDGKPVKQAMVEAHLEAGVRDVEWWGFENTDAAGRFELKNCVEGRPIRITVRRKSVFPETVLQHVLPSSDELVIHMPKESWVYIQGKVLDPEGKVLPNVHVSPAMKGGGGSPAETVDPSTGAFRYGPYPPGEYQLHVQAEGYAAIRIPWRKLAPDEVWDVGTLKFEHGGSLLVNVLPPDAETHAVWPSILDASGDFVEQMAVENGIARAGPLAPGVYSLQITGEHIACSVQSFEVRAGVELRIDVKLRKGIAAGIECLLPEDAPHGAGVQVVISDAAGNAVFRGTAWAPEGPPKITLSLSPGEYRIEAFADSLRGSGSLTVTVDGPAAKVDVRLTRQ